MFRSFAAFFATVSALLVAFPAAAAETLPEICARVDGEPITRFDVQRVFDVLMLSSGKGPTELDDAARAEGYRVVIDEIISDRLVARAAKDVSVADEEVEKRFVELKKGYGDKDSYEAAFREEMIKAGQTETLIRDNLRAALRQERWLATQVADKLTVTPAEIEKAYRENATTFTEPTTVRVSHILLQIAPGMPAEEIAAKEKLMKELMERAKKGELFADLAKKYSEDEATRERGGDLGYFVREAVDPAFAEAAFKIKPGDIIAPVRSKIGLHLIQGTGRREATPIPLEKVRENIVRLIQTDKRREALQKLLASLREKAKIELLLPK